MKQHGRGDVVMLVRARQVERWDSCLAVCVHHESANESESEHVRSGSGSARTRCECDSK